MSIQHVPDIDIRSYFVAYENDGKRPPDDPDGTMRAVITQAVREGHAIDALVISRGWKGDALAP